MSSCHNLPSHIIFSYFPIYFIASSKRPKMDLNITLSFFVILQTTIYYIIIKTTRISVFYITNEMQLNVMFFIIINALHVSGGPSAHHQANSSNPSTPTVDIRKA
jgi:hypothetical protein